MRQINRDILNKKYFIFDIDGTLLDSMPMWTQVDRAVLSELGLDVPAEEIKNFRDSIIYSSQHIAGDIYMAYYEALINLFDLDMTVEKFRDKRRSMAKFISVNELDYKDGADMLLKKLKDAGKKIGVVTTTTKRQYEIYENESINILKKAPLKKYIDKKVVCEDVERKKPDPEAYLKILDLLECDAKDCIVFEDSLNGVIAAKDAGLEVVAIYDESAKNEQEVIAKIADYQIDSFVDFIKQLGLDKEQSQPQ